MIKCHFSKWGFIAFVVCKIVNMDTFWVYRVNHTSQRLVFYDEITFGVTVDGRKNRRMFSMMFFPNLRFFPLDVR